MSGSLLVLYNTFMMIGVELGCIISTLIRLSEYRIFAEILIFAVPSVFSLIQVLLAIFVFIKPSPKELHENLDDGGCIDQLRRIYKDDDRKMNEFSLIVALTDQLRYVFPSFRELFTQRYLLITLKGILMLTLRNFTGTFTAVLFSGLILYEYGYFELFAYFEVFLIASSFIPFFFTDSKF